MLKYQRFHMTIYTHLEENTIKNNTIFSYMPDLKKKNPENALQIKMYWKIVSLLLTFYLLLILSSRIIKKIFFKMV